MGKGKAQGAAAKAKGKAKATVQKATGKATAKAHSFSKANLAKHDAQNKERPLEQKLSAFYKSTQAMEDEEAKDEAVDQLLSKLDNKQSQLLWKKFELARKTDPELQVEYSNIKGPGSDGKKRSLLKAFMLDGGSCKGAHYKQAWSQVSVTHRSALDASWEPLQAMLTRYGKQELASLVESGAIKVRKNPKDNRFYQFLDEVAKTSTVFEHTKAVGAKQEGNIDQKAFLEFARADFCDTTADTIFDWDQGSMAMVEAAGLAQGTTMEAGLASKLGMKQDPKDPAEAFHKEVDSMSTVGEKTSGAKILDKASKLKRVADQMLDSFRMLDTKAAKHNKDYMKLKEARAFLDKVIDKGQRVTPKEAKKVLLEAATAIKRTNKVIEEKKQLIKEAKKAKKDQQEEEEED